MSSQSSWKQNSSPNQLFAQHNQTASDYLHSTNSTQTYLHFHFQERRKKLKVSMTFVAYMSPFVIIFTLATYLTLSLAKEDFHNRKRFVTFFNNYYGLEHTPESTSFRALGLFGDLNFHKSRQQRRLKKRQQAPRTLQAMLLTAGDESDEEEAMIELVRSYRYERRHRPRRDLIPGLMASGSGTGTASNKRSAYIGPLSPLTMGNMLNTRTHSNAGQTNTPSERMASQSFMEPRKSVFLYHHGNYVRGSIAE